MPRKTTPVAVRQGMRMGQMIPSPEEMKMMASTKRKLSERYTEAADARSKSSRRQRCRSTPSCESKAVRGSGG
jgi:hypothetical protein